ncbi:MULTISPECIES: hypothetical protein [unclassified Paenibacillus]|uniref:Uncharacterized protein n=1 Tax=Paenibacillus provencensis TaxID=441151 RepID=A0ABW3PWM8_9BACL|nr:MULTISPECIES: hypothetical protein [unclassified Paenibacillus]MCM3127753.1 hypothetical protein [Paenibacillus sp. MER 78]SFS38400.1 hypothetical protein SAMN04488601_101211 [Paenibacillus sp. 453mf]
MMNNQMEKEAHKTIMITVNGEPVGSGYVFDGYTFAPIDNEQLNTEDHILTV